MQGLLLALTTAWLAAPIGYLLHVGSLVTVGLFVSRVRSYLEHGLLAGGSSGSLIARTHPSNPVESNVLAGLNFNYHNEHHRWPQVPSRHLPVVHREITGARLPSHDVSPTYAASLRVLIRNCRAGTRD